MKILFHHEVFHDLTLTQENKKFELRHAAWIAGIQIRKDASGNIHVNLDPSAPCWNDGIDGPLLEVT